MFKSGCFTVPLTLIVFAFLLAKDGQGHHFFGLIDGLIVGGLFGVAIGAALYGCSLLIGRLLQPKRGV